MLDNIDLRALVKSDNTQTVVQLAEQLNFSENTIHNHLKNIGMKCKVGKWVPHQLTENRRISE